MSHHREDSLLPIQYIAFALSKARNMFASRMDVALAGARGSDPRISALLLPFPVNELFFNQISDMSDTRRQLENGRPSSFLKDAT